MAMCPVCGAKISPWKMFILTNHNSITCTNCGSSLVANRTRNSLIGGLAAGIGGPLLLYCGKYGSISSFLLALFIWLITVALAANYLNRLEVKT